MQQTAEAEAFLKRIASLPAGPVLSLDDALQPSLNDEAELRKLFATDKTNARLNDPFVGLVDVFAAPPDIRTTRARVVTNDEELSRKYVMPLSMNNRRKEGTPCIVDDLEEFKKSWSVFTEGSLSQLFDWSNVVAAGGAVLACLAPLSDAAKESKRSMRKYYHSAAYPSSDVDLFLWGMDAAQAEKRINAIFEAVRDSVPWDVTCVRTKHTISIHSQYPYRSIQIVLRLYKSPAEIMAGFDIDAPCCFYNGERVYANPRAIVAMMRQCNTVDMTRRSPSYEVRLAKYSGRGFEVYVPTLERGKIDPTIYERSISRIEGLARLLVLEKLTNTDVRYAFLESRRTLRGRPNPLNQYRRRKRKHNGDLKANTSVAGLEMNDYDVATLHIPYGPGWDARRIDKLVYQTDLGMNSTFNPKNEGRRLHRHPAFFGTMVECLEDCCEHCPPPIDADERQLQEEEDKQYIRGRIAFIEEDPGRQSMSGSFNPIDVGEWSGQVYIGETGHFFAAIAAHDEEGVFRLLKKGADVHRRDHVGRTPLHVAILCKASEIACILIDAGARMTARLVDGRSCLHLAAQLDQPSVVRKLLERSVVNQEQNGAAKPEDKGDDVGANKPDAPERLSSEDDWSSEDDDMAMGSGDEGDCGDEGEQDGEDDNDNDKAQPKKDTKATILVEATRDPENFLEEDDEPDILDVNLPDWDLGFTPLAHAIMSGSLPVVETLLAGGADPKLINTTRGSGFHPLTLTILRKDEDEASRILERLILAGASTSTADDQMRTIFHRALVEDKLKLVSTILRCDPNAKAVLDFPSFVWQNAYFPLVSAIHRSKYAMIALILAHGASVVFTEEHVTRSMEAIPVNKRRYFLGYNSSSNVMHNTFQPLESAIAAHDGIAQLLIAIGAEVDIGCKKAYGQTNARSLADWVKFAVKAMDEKINAKKVELAYLTTETVVEADVVVAGQVPKTWKTYLVEEEAKLARTKQNSKADTKQQFVQGEITAFEELRNYMQEICSALVARGAKTWKDIYSDNLGIGDAITHPVTYAPPLTQSEPARTYAALDTYGSQAVPQHQVTQYDELFEACFASDNDKIQELCLPIEGKHKNLHPLQIQVQVANPLSIYQQTGYTPLYAAIGGRRWETAKLIMAIAAAQYRSTETEKKFSTEGINLDNDSDDESDSGNSDATVEREEPTFVDVAHRPSVIQTNVHPNRLLHLSNFRSAVEKEDGTYLNGYVNLLNKSVYENDFEAFVNILNLYKTSPLLITLNTNVVEAIIHQDRANMLDEYIRRTGVGIDVKHFQKGGEVWATNDTNRLYLGLSVHGKKRVDLAKKNDPNATYTPTTHPLLWRAVLAKAKGIVDYLSGDGPLAAYRFYASSGGDELALLLRRTEDLEKVLPQWLGWRLTALGESPFTVAILSKDLELLKKLFSKNPHLMASTLHEKIKFIGYNALMVAVDVGVDPAMIDYLLAKSISPAETHQVRGWNIYHILCRKNHCDLLAHLLTKLPRDVNEVLLAQHSKNTLDTPLHLAVKAAATRAVKLIVEFTTTTLLIRNSEGSTPLHMAVQKGLPKITGLLLKADPAALYMENGVGETPLEMATLKDIMERTQNFANQRTNEEPRTINVNDISREPKPIDIKRLEIELPRLRSMLEQLFSDGRLVKKTRLAEELVKFADMMDVKLAKAIAVESAKPVVVVVEQENKNPTEQINVQRTLEVVAEAVAAAPGHRQLVHLIDVQRSVQRGLDRVTPKQDKDVREDDEGLTKEEDSEAQERRESLVLQRIDIQSDDQEGLLLRYIS